MKVEELEKKANKMGLVPVKLLISEAGVGFRKGEIRGVTPAVAARMIDLKHAELVEVKAEAKSEAKA